MAFDISILPHNFASRLSRQSRHGTQISCLGSKHTLLLISLLPPFPVYLQHNIVYCRCRPHLYQHPISSTDATRLPPRSWCTGVWSTPVFFYPHIHLIFSHCYRGPRLPFSPSNSTISLSYDHCCTMSVALWLHTVAGGPAHHSKALLDRRRHSSWHPGAALGFAAMNVCIYPHSSDFL